MCMNILKGKKILLCGLCFCFTIQERSVSVGLTLLFQGSKLLFCINSVVVFVSLFFLYSKAEKKRWGSLQQKKNYNRGTRFFFSGLGELVYKWRRDRKCSTTPIWFWLYPSILHFLFYIIYVDLISLSTVILLWYKNLLHVL